MLRPALTALALPSAPATAQGLEGTWLGFGATAILLGFTVPVIEELTVEGDLARQRGWTTVDPAACTGGTDQPPACAGAVEIGAVRLLSDKARLSAVPEGVQTIPYAHPGDAGFWPLFRLAGHDWLVRSGDDAAVLSRDAVIEGEPLTIERVYLRAPAGTGGQLFDYLIAMEVSVSRSLCGLQAIHADPVAWPAFLAQLQALAPVTADPGQIRRLPTRPRAVSLRAMTLMRGAEAMGDLAGFVEDIPEAARQAWLDHLAWVQAGAQPPPGLVTVPHLPFPAAPETAARAAACLEYFEIY
jgi:hypothetical protein